jgi:hypothetical protein
VPDVVINKSELLKKYHNFIHELLLLGDVDPQMSYQIHLQKKIFHHQELIEAIKDAI